MTNIQTCLLPESSDDLSCMSQTKGSKAPALDSSSRLVAAYIDGRRALTPKPQDLAYYINPVCTKFHWQ
jgi:hypothetical protein